MPTSSPLKWQFDLLKGGFALTLLCLGVFNTVQAQPGIPGRPNFPQPNIPRPNFPQPNIPQPNFPQPNIPQPNIPRPNIPGMGGPQMPNIPGPNFGGFETIYTCSKCNVEIGRGIVAPAIATCPRCGLVYRNGVAWDDGKAAPPAMPVNLPNFGIPGGNNNVNNPPLPPIDLNSAVASNPSVPVTVVPPPSSNRVLFIIGGVVLALLVILGMVLAILHTNKSKAKAARKVRRRRPAQDDEDFDD